MAKGISRICVCFVCLAAITVLHVLTAAAQDQSRGEKKPGQPTPGIVGDWTAEDRHLSLGSLYQPSQGIQKRQATLHFKQVGTRYTGYAEAPKSEGSSIEKDAATGRIDFSTVTFSNGRLLFAFEVKELQHGWGGRLKGAGTIRVDARLKDDQLVGKWSLFLADGSEPFRGEWEAVRAGQMIKEDKKEEDPDALPRSATWDVKALDEIGRVVKASYDAEKGQVHWTLEAKRNIGQLQVFGGTYYGQFFDAEGIRLEELTVNFTPNYGIKRGDKVRATLSLPSGSFSKTKKVVIVSKK